jgi:hypothetical protein
VMWQALETENGKVCIEETYRQGREKGGRQGSEGGGKEATLYSALFLTWSKYL